MTIQNEKFATFTYTLFESSTEGNVIEEVTAENPMAVVFGQGRLIPFFEERLIGMTSGDDFEIKVPAGEAFGEQNPNAVYELSKETFRVNDVIDESLFVIGNKIPMRDRTGNVLDGYVTSTSETNVTLDFNHPLAGKDIVFKGSVIEVREATFEELNPPQHGGCGCGSGSGDGSCSTEKGEGESCCSTEGAGHDHGHDHGHGGCGCH